MHISGKLEGWETFRNQQKATWREKNKGKLVNNIKEESKSFFRYIKRQARVDIGPLENDAGEIVMGNKEMADELNHCFAPVFTLENTGNMPDIQENQSGQK